MNSNREICITAHKAIIKCIVLLYNGILLFRTKAYGDLARYIARRYRDITYKLVYKSMYSNREMCIIVIRSFIRCVALL